jgi:hypothetical protein
MRQPKSSKHSKAKAMLEENGWKVFTPLEQK